MADFSINEMLEMQRILQDNYKNKWEPFSPETGNNKLLWMLIYHFGYIASIAGLVIIICAMKGYEILGGALDKKGVIIVGIVSIVMVFVANHLSWTMDVYIELKDLGLEYFLTIIGGASTLFGNFRRA